MRKLGSVDRRPRRRRSDRGKKRTRYAGQPCKHKTQKWYKKHKGNKSEIKIFIKRIDQMSETGRMMFPKKSRNKITHQVWIPLKGQSYYVKVKEIEDREKLGNYIARRYPLGTYAVCTFINKKTRDKKGSNKARVIIVVGESEDGNYVKSFRNHRSRGMHTYWFWKD